MVKGSIENVRSSLQIWLCFYPLWQMVHHIQLLQICDDGQTDTENRWYIIYVCLTEKL